MRRTGKAERRATTDRTTKAGQRLERHVADVFREMGASWVEHDVELAGNQIDLYVELVTPGRLLHRIAIEAKDWNSPVGIDIVNDFAQIVDLLRRERLVDEGIIISEAGFSRPARNAARTYGIRLLEPPDLEVMVTKAKSAAWQSRLTSHGGDQNLVSPGRPGRRRTVAIVVILAVLISLVLSILTQPWNSREPRASMLPLSSLLWILQVLVSFIAILASVMQLSGLDVRELFSTRPAGAGIEAFPFHVIRDFDELLDHLFPDPTDPLLPDRSIPFLPRIAGELETAFRQHKRILVRGRSKTGKTRETIELLRRWWYTGPTVLLAKNHVGLYPPYKVPPTLPVRNLVLLFDDVDRYCGDADALKRLDQTIAFFANLCHDPGDLRVIATVRQEPEFWGKLHYDEAIPPWAEFEMLSLPALPPDLARRLIDHLARACGIVVNPTVAEDIAAKNDGTFLNLVLSFRGWSHEGITRIGSEQATAFEGNLVTTWRRRYERLADVLPEAPPIYAAVDFLQRLDVPLQPALITDVATEMHLSRAYHLVAGLFHWVRRKFELSPGFDWYRNPRQQRRWIAIGIPVAIIVTYILLYLLFCVAPVSFQVGFFSALASELWLQLLIVSPLLTPLLPLTLSHMLRRYRHWGERRVKGTLDCLLATEIPIRKDKLRPYEGQFEGNGASQAWPSTSFAGHGGTATFWRLAAPRLATIYWGWAEKLRVAGELGPARSLASLARVLAPNHPMSSFVLGKLWYDEGDFRRALAEFDRSRALNPTVTAALALERVAWCFYHLEEHEQAETAAEQALTLMPTLSIARWARGLARLQQGYIESGLADCRQAALDKESLSPDLASALDAALSTASRQDWAGDVSRLLDRDRPTRKRHRVVWRRVIWGLATGLTLAAALTLLMGVSYVSRNLEENATFNLRLMDVLLKLYPHAPALLTRRTETYIKLGDYDQAIAECTEVIHLEPDCAYAYQHRCWAYDELGSYERAVADCTQAILLDPDGAYAYLNRCWAYNELGSYERAIADCTKAILLNPGVAYAYQLRCWARIELGDFEQAITDCTDAIRLDSDWAYAYNDRCRAYDGLGSYGQAIADCTKAIHLDADCAPAYQNRGYVHKNRGDLDAARADWERAIELYETQEESDRAGQVRSLLSSLEN